jgi:translation initiation factor 1
MQDGRCACRRVRPGSGDGVVRVGRETSGRKGKTVTTVDGVPGTDADLRALAGELKRACGSGGSLRDGVIEIQGDHRNKVIAHLQAAGHTVKAAGG